jgi:hypothetical protein
MQEIEQSREQLPKEHREIHQRKQSNTLRLCGELIALWTGGLPGNPHDISLRPGFADIGQHHATCCMQPIKIVPGMPILFLLS